MPVPCPCPCGLPAAYDDCCGRLHRGDAAAATAEALMRSRYSAFVIGDVAYLRATWDPATRPRRVDPDPAIRWSGLDVVDRTGGLLAVEATVTFHAHHTAGTVTECSRFRRESGRWLYVGPA